jgi:small-conductance mechanosensitive channel/CRP-like cAMP-binding protein
MPETVNTVIGYAWPREAPWLLGMVLVLGALLWRARREDHRFVGNTIGLYLLSLTAQFVAGAIFAAGFGSAAAVVAEAGIIAGGVAAIRLWGMVLFRMVLPALRLQAPHIIEDLLVMIAYIAWGLVRLRYAGLDLSQIVTASAVITAVIAFSMQDTLGNILGGIALQLDESVEVGDWVRIDDVVGRVTDIRWRSTLVKTRNGETVVIPNSQLMKTKFAVLGRSGGKPVHLRRWIWFNVDYSTAPPRVIETVERAIREAEIANVAKEPAPNAVLMEFESGYGRYALRYWLTDLAQDDPTDTDVRAHVLAALQRAGLRLAVPEHRAYTAKEGEKHEETVRARDIAHRLAALRRVDLFASLTDAELKALAERLQYSPFARGEVMTRQGAVAHWLYVITAGEAEVYLESDGRRQRLNTLSAGSFFGEMGLMTGAPRAATVVATTSVECYRLDKAAFQEIVQLRPGMVEEIAQVLAARRVALDAAQQGMTRTEGARTAHDQVELLDRVRRFFGISS